MLVLIVHLARRGSLWDEQKGYDARPEIANAPKSRPRSPNWVLPLFAGAFLASIAFLVAPHRTPQPPPQPVLVSLPSLGDLALMSAAELEQQEIALLNLRCVDGLQDVDIEKCLATLDRWVETVKRDTDRHLYRFQQDPGEYENSEGCYRMMMLITVLQQDFKVHYNPDRIRSVDFQNPKDLFIHGILVSDNGGTCVSMPVVYTAVARRLGYPVYLVTAKAHVFCRWDSKDDRFNIEATNQGMSSFGDDYYMEWPKPITDAKSKRDIISSRWTHRRRSPSSLLRGGIVCTTRDNWRRLALHTRLLHKRHRNNLRIRAFWQRLWGYLVGGSLNRRWCTAIPPFQHRAIHKRRKSGFNLERGFTYESQMSFRDAWILPDGFHVRASVSLLCSAFGEVY